MHIGDEYGGRQANCTQLGEVPFMDQSLNQILVLLEDYGLGQIVELIGDVHKVGHQCFCSLVLENKAHAKCLSQLVPDQELCLKGHSFLLNEVF